jgi:hypothetical protein
VFVPCVPSVSRLPSVCLLIRCLRTDVKFFKFAPEAER